MFYSIGCTNDWPREPREFREWEILSRDYKMSFMTIGGIAPSPFSMAFAEAYDRVSYRLLQLRYGAEFDGDVNRRAAADVYEHEATLEGCYWGLRDLEMPDDESILIDGPAEVLGALVPNEKKTVRLRGRMTDIRGSKWRSMGRPRIHVAQVEILGSPCGKSSPRTVIATPRVDAAGKIDADFVKAHERLVARGAEATGVLFIGDSITAGWFWDHNKAIWDRAFGRDQPANFGIGGDRTEHVLWRIENGELDRIRPHVVVLLIGTNNIGDPAADIAAGVAAVANHVHDKLPSSRLLLLGIFPRGANPADPAVAEMRTKIREVNAQLAKLDDGRRTRFLDIGDRFLSTDRTLAADIMPDALHLSAKGYEIWAAAMKPLLDAMMK